MLFGMGEVFRVSVVAATTFFLVNSFCFKAISQLNPDYFELARIYEKGQLQVAYEILLPASLPEILHALRFSFMFGWLAIVIAESAAAELPRCGLGYYIIRAKGTLPNYPVMFAGTIVLGVLAFLLDRVVVWIQRRVSVWAETSDVSEELEVSREVS
jgi:NitT/TauT family transport system permease protein